MGTPVPVKNVSMYGELRQFAFYKIQVDLKINFQSSINLEAA